MTKMTMIAARTSAAIDLMMTFAKRTGLAAAGPRRRYLWTDAFAVCNFLGLQEATSDARYGELALRLVEQVHRELGRFRSDDERKGWISLLDEADGARHPTRGGLRIGKPHGERRPLEPLDLDPDAEWDRDGQYFHYLTKWAHALDQVARATRDAKYHEWARELMQTAHRAFVHGPPGRRRMVWKLSTDLSRPVVPSMGQHDPLDGLVTCTALDATAKELGFSASPILAAADFAEMVHPETLATTDPLGLGGLLFDVCRLVRIDPMDSSLVATLIAEAIEGLREYLALSEWHGSADRRLAFRELGLAIGLECLSMLASGPRMAHVDDRTKLGIATLERFAPLRVELEAFWMHPKNRRTSLWAEHEDIDDVMLATSLVPRGFLG